MKILAVIPARGGSKGVPRKNIKPLLGRSLVERTLEQARACSHIDRIILSTDDDEILAHASDLGLETAPKRAEHLSSDHTAMIDVVLDLLIGLEDREGYIPDVVLLLQPTSPLRDVRHIDTAISMIGDNDSVCAVIEVPQELNPQFVMKIGAEGYLDYYLPEGRNVKRRQDVMPAYRRDGTVYLTKRDVLFEHQNFYGASCIPMMIDPAESLSIDTDKDWQRAESVLSKRNNS